MALKKDIIFTNGVNIKYHYISDIQINGKDKIAKLKITSYTDDTFRQKEKNNDLAKKTYEDLLKKILDENTKDIVDVELVKSWSEEANKLAYSYDKDLDLSVISQEIELKDITDYNYSNLYTLLKEQEFFAGSEDI